MKINKPLLLAIGLIVLSVFLFRIISNSKGKTRRALPKAIKTVAVKTVKNGDIPIIISKNGRLQAKQRIDLYAEVQGVFKKSDNPFKSGQSYRKGAVLVEIDNVEFLSTVQAQKSDFYNLIITTLPDLRLDFLEFYPKWQDYITIFDMNKPTPPLPNMSSQKERFFINSRGITKAYYNLKNLESRLEKYHIVAPFSGVLTEANIQQGTLIRNGQKLGEFIDPTVFELEINIPEKVSRLLEIGKKVIVFKQHTDDLWLGKVIRINEKVNIQTQTISIFIEVSGQGLKEGMYLSANIDAGIEPNAVEIPRELLSSENNIFIAKDSVLSILEIDPVHLSKKSVIVKGIPDNTKIVVNTISGAFEGMPIKIESSVR